MTIDFEMAKKAPMIRVHRILSSSEPSPLLNISALKPRLCL